MSDPILDRARLTSFTAGDRRLERELVELYLETAALYLDRMRRAIDGPGAWRSAAHALKGASANLGALAVARLAARQELTPPDIAALDALACEIASVRRLTTEDAAE